MRLAARLLKNEQLLLTMRTHGEVLARALGEATGVDSVACRLSTRPEDEALWRYCVLSARQPGAANAPFYFVSAFLFSADINTLYEALDGPVWVSMATRGDFTDYQGRHTVAGRANWQFQAIDGGALPFFEDLAGFTAQLDPFWA